MIRNFAKAVEGWQKNAMSSLSSPSTPPTTLSISTATAENTAAAVVPADMKAAKLEVLQVFAQALRRYTSLNHLAQAARAVLGNPQQINQMLADLARIDFHHIQVFILQLSD